MVRRTRGERDVRRLAPDEAARAIYIDFEGTKKDPPSLLGVLWFDGAESRFMQHIVEEALWPAAEAKTDTESWVRRPAHWGDLVGVRRLAESEGRRVLSWSEHDQRMLAEFMPDPADRAWFAANVESAIPLARRWRNKFPRASDVQSEKLANRLDVYLARVGHKVKGKYAAGGTADRIRYVRKTFEKRGPTYAALTPGARRKWNEVLIHNWHDCEGMRRIVVRCAKDLAKR